MKATTLTPATRELTTAGIFAVAALVFASEGSFAAGTLYAKTDGSDSAGCGQKTNPCRSIGQAIRNASSGDTVLVGAGHYGDLNGDGQFGGPGEEQLDRLFGCMICINKPLRVLSLNGARVTIINGAAEPNSANTVVSIDANNVTFGAVNSGFTIAGGSVVGLAVKGANIRIGGNIASHDGQDGFAFGSVNGLQVTDNTVADNVEAGVLIDGLLSPSTGEFVKTFRGNTLTGNFGPGLYMGIPIQTLTGNNFYGNDTNATRVTQVAGQHCGVVSGTTVFNPFVTQGFAITK